MSIEKAAKWLSFGKSDHFFVSGYRLKGIFSDWRNPATLKENNYNQAPQMDDVTRDTLYRPKFVMANPNDLLVSEYYDALASTLGQSNNERLAFPRYSIDKQLTAEQRIDLLSDMAEAVSNEKESEAHSSVGLSDHADITDEALFHFLQGRAVLGDDTAQFTLGQMYQEGIGTQQNIEEAILNYERAAAQQDLRAEYNLALLYLEGQGGMPADERKAIDLLRDAAFKGNTYAQYALGRINELGYRRATGDVALQPDPEQAMAMYELAATNDDGLAQYRLAEMLVRDKKVDLSLASQQHRHEILKQLYQGASDAGVEQAALPLAFFHAMDHHKATQKQAAEVARKEAEKGVPGAALLLGLMYDRGIGVEADHSEALDWYQKEPSNPVTAFILGTYTSQGMGTQKDIAKGTSLLQESADSGFSYANVNLAVIKQEQGESFLPNLEKALALGNSTAGVLLADYYLSSANDEKQMRDARDIYQHLAEQGDKEGQLKLGYMFDKGLGGTIDPIQAEKWYRFSAEQGQEVAQYLLGNLYQIGRIGTQPDYELAKKWYRSAKDHFSPAAVALGFIHDTVEDDYQQAAMAYQQAAEQHSSIGQFNLGLIYEQGKGRPVNDVKAQALYQEAANNGHRQAMVQLAGFYLNGQDGSRDPEQAFTWYKKASEQGDRDALYQLGLLSETGVGTALDFPQAIKYYEQAADKGNANGMLALARIYQYGLGVVKDTQRAETYYKELAAQGNAYAQYQLATFYYEGLLGQRMPTEGKKMLQSAVENGSQQALRALQWLAAQSQERTSFVEPLFMNQKPIASEQPAELMYLEALNEWNRGDERSSRLILDQLMTQFPHYDPAKRAYEQLQHQPKPPAIFG